MTDRLENLDLKTFANSWPSASNFKGFSRSLEQFFLTVGQNNFGNKIPFTLFIIWCKKRDKNRSANNAGIVLLEK